ncbi:fibroblast growth factor-binding protein 3 [Eublepharis macularius]|uniref:Fibroblast growth factor-binding protein 3 n=1 Tax=Eublepharis macularius TaxID=481883 RepID=A0AA97L2J8_EUBMA|nr:fibroblast growth factor-binding protein 3 [Eublepharis macularius]XP_054840095.1 fibroblast growth factor-binding protein 3 [Eublepharis macularius]
MRLPQTFPLTLLFLSCLEGAAGRKGKENSEKAEPSAPWAQTGQFSTRDKHLCSWQLIPGEEVTEIHLSCHQPGEDSGTGQQCVYRGQPELCAAYSSKGRQFWKQILGKLRRKHHPCQDSSPLKSRLCSSKKGASEAELHLVPPALTTASPLPKGTSKGKSKGKARVKDLPAPPKPPQTSRARVVTSSAKADEADKRNKGGKKKVTPGSSVAPTHLSSRGPTAVVESTEQPTELNADVAAAYCEEKWHSLCNFFVNFWNG